MVAVVAEEVALVHNSSIAFGSLQCTSSAVISPLCLLLNKIFWYTRASILSCVVYNCDVNKDAKQFVYCCL